MILFFLFFLSFQNVNVSAWTPWTQDIIWTYISRPEDVLDAQFMYVQFTSCAQGEYVTEYVTHYTIVNHDFKIFLKIKV